jgi:hypothetical protein
VWHALRPRLDEDGLQLARQLLSDAEARLFFAMEKSDQRHAIAVMTQLRSLGVEDRDVLVAALLHDCAKGMVPLWLRIAKVVAPGVVTSAAVSGAPGWRGAAYRLIHDATLSAALAENAGSSRLIVGLIQGRVTPDQEPKLALLRAADDAS